VVREFSPQAYVSCSETNSLSLLFSPSQIKRLVRLSSACGSIGSTEASKGEGECGRRIVEWVGKVVLQSEKVQALKELGV
jgi:hypothetical protein